MSRHAPTFRNHARISSLCPVFDATLRLLSEEGIALHHVHERPLPVVATLSGSLRPRVDRRLAVILGVHRTSPLLPHMELDLQGLVAPPQETLFLEIPVGPRTLRTRTRLAQEASDIFVGLAEAELAVKVVSFSHRREVHGSLVVRHYPVAVFDRAGTLLWKHPAAPAYGLIRGGFPTTQTVRSLGPLRDRLRPEDLHRRLDDGSGLPTWYRFACDRLQDEHPDAIVSFADVIQHQAELWLASGLETNLDRALQEATQDYLRGFEIFFGMGGLHPTPTLLTFA